jgi:hypothetical protein
MRVESSAIEPARVPFLLPTGLTRREKQATPAPARTMLVGVGSR